jgi:hypothetical protein
MRFTTITAAANVLSITTEAWAIKKPPALA